jgi:hypothetical protein
MFSPGDTLKLDSGRTIRLDGILAPGGQGTAYNATDLSARQQGVFKLFGNPTSETVTRLRFLVGLKLQTICPVLYAPIDSLTRGGSAGTYAPLAPGQILEEFLASYPATFIEGLQLATAVSAAVKVLHDQRLVHGDLHAANMLVHRYASVLKPFLIDLDNFRAPGVPDPPCVGHNLYMAPELRLALANHRTAVPDERSELYSLGVLNYEILLVRHPATGADADEQQFHKAMCSGWIHDPARADRVSGVLGGLPVEVLNADLMRLFRRGLSADRSERPTAAEWVGELSRALHQIFACTHCGGPCVLDASKNACPICRQAFPTFKLVGAFGQIQLRDASTVVGRSNLGGSSKVSARHAVIRRHGPEYRLESKGQNGTRRWASDWIRLPDDQPVLIQAGDRLKFADVEAQVVDS